ncbi:MAG: hypothetical protein FWH16_04510 [Oscillospiraceae bacterium]|nr:hypothetical protein [Oscillospiraceae bacterium]
MICRRCGQDIMEGSANCPMCGIAQTSYIKPRDYSKMSARKKRRGNRVVSILTIIISVVGIVAMVFFSGRSTEEKDFQKILDAYEARDDQLLMVTVAQYRNNYPKSTARIAEAEGLLLILRGYGGETPVTPPADLKDVYADERIGFEGVVLGEPNFELARSLVIYWRNITEREIAHIYFKAMAYDSGGKPASCTVRGMPEALLEQKNIFKPNPEGDVYRTYWPNVWYGENIEYVRIESVIIYYDNGAHEVLPMRGQ